MNWKVAGQICGVLSKFAFMVHSKMYEIDDEEVKAFYNALWKFSEGILPRDEMDTLVECIKEKNGSNYWVDEEPLNFYDDEDEELDDECCDCCEKCCSDYQPKHNHDEEKIDDLLSCLDNIKSIVINFREEEDD